MTPERSDSSRSRAEQLRQKRQQSSQQRVDTARQQASRVTGQNVSTTVRRSSPYSVPVTRSTRSSSVRRVHYTQVGNGVEMRLPALPQVQFSWQMASVFLAIATLILVILLTTLDTFQVKNVEVTGNSRVAASEIQTVINGANHSVFTLDRRITVNALLTAFPELTNVHLKVSFPDTVVLSVSERKPVLAWEGPDTVQWIDAQGVVMPARGDGGTLLAVKSTVAVPLLVTAEDTAAADTETTTDATAVATQSTEPDIYYIDPQVLQTAISLGAQLPEGASLVYDPISGMGWKDPKGWRVYFGLDLSNIQMKLIEYQAIVERLSALGVKASYISVEHLDAPYYRTE
jgi:cell division protein FtsQ